MAMQVSRERSKTVHHIGIDLAKRKHSAAVVGGDGERILRGFEFANDAEGFASLLEKLASVGAGCDDSGVCLEATGHYGRNLIAFLEGHGYEVFEVNPLLTSNWRKATSVRKVKNDAIDAEALALWLLAGNPTRRRRSKSESDDLRSLARSRTSLSHIVGDCKRRAHAILDVVFPEFHGFFADDFGKSASAVLRRWGSAEALAKARVDSVEKAIRSGGGRRFTRADAERLKELARSSVGQPSAPLSFQLRQLLDQIEFTRSQMKELDAELEKLVGDSPITTDAPRRRDRVRSGHPGRDRRRVALRRRLEDARLRGMRPVGVRVRRVRRRPGPDVEARIAVSSLVPVAGGGPRPHVRPRPSRLLREEAGRRQVPQGGGKRRGPQALQHHLRGAPRRQALRLPRELSWRRQSPVQLKPIAIGLSRRA